MRGRPAHEATNAFSHFQRKACSFVRLSVCPSMSPDLRTKLYQNPNRERVFVNNDSDSGARSAHQNTFDLRKRIDYNEISQKEREGVVLTNTGST